MGNLELQNGEKTITSERIFAIDFLRGLAILCMMFFHGLIYFDQTGLATELNSQVAEQNLGGIGYILINYFARWAGIFALITGFGNSVAISKRISRMKKNQDPISFKLVVLKPFIVAFFTLILSYIHKIFFLPTIQGTPIPIANNDPIYSIITGTLQTGSLQIPNFYKAFVYMDALAMIASATFFVSVVLYFLNRKKGSEKYRRNLWILIGLGTFLILITPLIKLIIRPLWISTFTNNNRGWQIILGFLVGDQFCFFPYAGYAIYGASFGLIIRLAENQAKKQVKDQSKMREQMIRKSIKFPLIMGIIYVLFAFIGYSQFGAPLLEQMFEIPPWYVIFAEIGGMMIVVSAIILMENSKIKKFRRIVHSRFIRRFGLVSLTLFIFEFSLGELIKVSVLDRIFPNHWNRNILLVLIYDVLLILLWWMFLKIWEKKDYQGSVKWWMAVIAAKIMRKPFNGLHIKESLKKERRYSKKNPKNELPKKVLK